MEPLATIPAAGLRWLRIILALSVLAMVFSTAAALLFTQGETRLAVIITTASLFLIVPVVWLIVPGRYEVWPDHLRLVFPLGGWDLPYDTIELIRPAHSWEPYAFAGVRFATSPGKSVVVQRRNANLFGRPSIVISTEDNARLISAAQRASGRSLTG